MKTVVSLVAAFLLLAAVPSFGQISNKPCVPGTLASYIALGSTGCVFEGSSYSNFAYLATSASGITPAQIEVDPIPAGPIVDPPLAVGLNFSANWQAAKDQTEQSVISYTVTPIAPVSQVSSGTISLLLGNASVGGIIGEASVTETTSVGTLSVFDRCADACSLKKTDQLTYSPLQILHVTDTIALSGGTGGVSLGSFTTNYNVCPGCPEPQ